MKLNENGRVILMIYLLWCTIRPQMFMDTHGYWLKTCRNRANVKTKVAVDTEEDKDILKDYSQSYNCEILVVEKVQPGSAYPTYCLTSQLEGNKKDILWKNSKITAVVF